MERWEKEYLISRISCGYIIYQDLKIRFPSAKVKYYLNKVAYDCIQSCKSEGILTKDELLALMIQSGRWSPTEDKRLEELDKALDDLRVDLYKNWFRVSNRKRIKELIGRVELESIILLNKKHEFDYVSCEGIANYVKMNHFIEKCTYQHGKLYDWSEYQPEYILDVFYNSMLGDNSLRELARTEPWANIFSCTKKPFTRRTEDLTDEQIRLILWTKMYNSVKEHPECPSDDILEDNDAIDGWNIMQRRTRESKQKTNQIESSLSDKIANAQEIFIPVSSAEEAKSVYSLNNPAYKIS